jgi:hypothetical protein
MDDVKDWEHWPDQVDKKLILTVRNEQNIQTVLPPIYDELAEEIVWRLQKQDIHGKIRKG